MNINKQNYNEYVKSKTPNSPILKNVIKAFIIGGLICMLGQAITDLCLYWGISKEDVKTITPMALIFLSAFFTGVGLYDKLGKHAGAGSLVPITGFANAVVSSAIEFKKEGFILGVGAKMFTIAGPVIVYGVITSVAYGIILYIVQLIWR